MAVPDGTVPITGPLVDGTGELLAPSAALRDAGAVYLLDGRLRKVNDAGTPGSIFQGTPSMPLSPTIRSWGSSGMTPAAMT